MLLYVAVGMSFHPILNQTAMMFSNQIMCHDFFWRNMRFYLNIIIWYFVILGFQKNAVFMFTTLLLPTEKYLKILLLPKYNS